MLIIQTEAIDPSPLIRLLGRLDIDYVLEKHNHVSVFKIVSGTIEQLIKLTYHLGSFSWDYNIFSDIDYCYLNTVSKELMESL